jgi:hypothetical protein
MQDYIDELAAEAFEKIDTAAWEKAEEIKNHIPLRPADVGQLKHLLVRNPALQATLASITGYTPSKWLLRHELVEVRARRKALNLVPELLANDLSAEDPLQSASRMGLMGLCLSGGGIRSATFNLGVLQGLAELGLLRCFDYLASVSGGGYIHQFLAAWIHRDGFNDVNHKLIPQPELGCPASQPEPIRWLRRYSNYLTPQLGMLSGDTWVMVATWLRNTLLNQAILCNSLLAMILVIVNLSRIPPVFMGGPVTAIAIGIVFALFIAGSSFAVENLMDFGGVQPEQRALHRSRVQVMVTAPLLLAALVAGMLFPWLSEDFVLLKQFLAFRAGVVLLFMLAACLTFGGGAHLCYMRSLRGVSSGETFGEFWRRRPKCRAHLKVAFAILGFLIADAISAVGGAAWISALEYLLFQYWHVASHHPVQYVLVFGAPLVLSGLLITILLVVGLLGRSYFDGKREWLARLGGWFLLYSIAWLVVTGIALFSSTGVAWLALHGSTKSVKAAVLAWLTTTFGGVVAAKSSKSAGVSDAKQGPKSPYSEALAAIAPYVFIVGLLILLSLAAESISRPLCGWQISLLIVASAIVSIVLAFRVDINEFSMHAFYRNRLARCYLGASNAARSPDPFTGFDEHDAAIPISELCCAHGYHGPFPIFCTSLNLTFGQDLAFQERKAASFAFTPLYSGYDISWTASRSERTRMRFNGFAKTETYAYGKPGIHISTAAAISGAAVSPNQGYHSTPAIAFLLTVFNVRLGWWLANPRKLTESGRLIRDDRDLVDDGPGSGGSSYPSASPPISLFYLASELLGQADDTRRYVYLSDGGHFDNMGLYELVRRRCRFIVIGDAEQDADLKFEGIGMAIRKCRIDFGAEIALDVRSLQLAKDEHVSAAHCVTGTIRYPEDPGGEPSGIVVYIKSSLTGDEPADIVNYKNTDAAFPHDSTGNQWFSESLFESYRRLGHHIALSCFAPAVPSVLSCDKTQGRRDFFSNMRRIWAPFTPEMNKFSGDHSSRYAALLEKIRSDSSLPGLFDQLFERSGAARDKLAAKLTGDNLEYAIRFSSSIIEFIFTVYEQLRLTYQENREHPFAQGWLDIFRNWYEVGVIQQAWERFSPTYTDGFQIFFKREIADPKFHLPKQP